MISLCLYREFKFDPTLWSWETASRLLYVIINHFQCLYWTTLRRLFHVVYTVQATDFQSLAPISPCMFPTLITASIKHNHKESLNTVNLYQLGFKPLVRYKQCNKRQEHKGDNDHQGLRRTKLEQTPLFRSFWFLNHPEDVRRWEWGKNNPVSLTIFRAFSSRTNFLTPQV